MAKNAYGEEYTPPPQNAPKQPTPTPMGPGLSGDPGRKPEDIGSNEYWEGQNLAHKYNPYQSGNEQGVQNQWQDILAKKKQQLRDEAMRNMPPGPPGYWEQNAGAIGAEIDRQVESGLNSWLSSEEGQGLQNEFNTQVARARNVDAMAQQRERVLGTDLSRRAQLDAMRQRMDAERGVQEGVSQQLMGLAGTSPLQDAAAQQQREMFYRQALASQGARGVLAMTQAAPQAAGGLSDVARAAGMERLASAQRGFGSASALRQGGLGRSAQELALAKDELGFDAAKRRAAQEWIKLGAQDRMSDQADLLKFGIGREYGQPGQSTGDTVAGFVNAGSQLLSAYGNYKKATS